MPENISWSWSFQCVRSALVGYKELALSNPQLSHQDILKIVSLKSYPFCGRENWPYKAWLNTIHRMKAVPRETLLRSTSEEVRAILRKKPKRIGVSSESQPMLEGMEEEG